MKQNDHEIKRIIAELIEQFGDAIAIVVSAIAKEGDAEKLKVALQSRIIAANTTKTAGKVSIHIATSALAAVEAVCKENQASEPDQYKH